MQRVFLSAPLAFEKGSAVKTAACGRVLGSWGVESSSIPASRGGMWVGHGHGRDRTCRQASSGSFLRPLQVKYGELPGLSLSEPRPPTSGPSTFHLPSGSSPTPSSSAAAEPPSYADVGPAWGRSPAHVWCPRPDLVPTLQFTASPHCPVLVFSAPSTAKSLLSSFSLRLQARRHTWPVWPRLCDLLRITALVCVPPRSFSWTPGWASDAKSWPNLIPKPDHHVKVSFFLSACGTGLPPRLTSLLTSSIFSIAHGI